jgi:hypothetical protein
VARQYIMARNAWLRKLLNSLWMENKAKKKERKNNVKKRPVFFSPFKGMCCAIKT